MSDGVPPVLVLGLGNLLLRDDAAGLELLGRMAAARGGDHRVEFVDGGTQGMALCGLLEGRRAVLLLDAVELGAEAGSVHRLEDPLQVAPGSGTTAHEANAGDLLAAAALLGHLPPRVVVLGIEPGVVRTGVGLSAAVRGALSEAQRLGEELLDRMLEGAPEERACTR